MARDDGKKGKTYELLDGKRCKCGHTIDEQHTAKVEILEEKGRFIKFTVRITCDYCRWKCKNMSMYD